ncbi:MAG: 1,4-dihydroxy-6-naphthoate synthase [Sediminibacterium sp.]|jgi:1,4-dihydroxy-6-naphthoate synthase|nr:1,4-dihydroxy-6-naphthoate synthase [Sediminibacterium sp.]
MPEFEIGFSPCPNDTFIFDALVNHKIDTKGYTFKVHLQDVQTLNEWAIAGKLPFSKISYGVWPLVKNKYALLNSGGALGKGVGPLLVYKEDKTLPDGRPDASTMRVAIPGVNTTAHLLFSLAFPNVSNKEFLVFNEIENAVLNGKVDAGVIIHENRFTYADKGLTKWLDLGTYFEETFNAPIPLGGIIARNDVHANEMAIVDDLIKQSVQYAFANSYDNLPDYVKCHSQEMSEQVMRQHIDLYVNDFTIDMGDTGRKAIAQLEASFSELNK